MSATFFIGLFIGVGIGAVLMAALIAWRLYKAIGL
jgi:hypothetical protein